MTPWIIIIAFAFGAGMWLQWRRVHAHVEELRADNRKLTKEKTDLFLRLADAKKPMRVIVQPDFEIDWGDDDFDAEKAPGAGERASE